MKRLIRLPDDSFGNKMNYILKEEYNGFGLYQMKCATGAFIHQEFLITNEDIVIQCQSYNQMIKEELFDAINEYNTNKKFGLKVFKKDEHLYYVHPSGNIII